MAPVVLSGMIRGGAGFAGWANPGCGPGRQRQVGVAEATESFCVVLHGGDGPVSLNVAGLAGARIGVLAGISRSAGDFLLKTAANRPGHAGFQNVSRKGLLFGPKCLRSFGRNAK